MKRIPLTKGKFALVDDQDYEWLSKWKWCITGSKDRAVRRRKKDDPPGRSQILMHRVIIGAVEDQVVDHINGDTLDNRRSNLRACTQRENMYNSRGHCDAASKFKGVTFDKQKSKWRAEIRADGHNRFLGYFQDEEAAAVAYQHEARKVQGAFMATDMLLKKLQ